MENQDARVLVLGYTYLENSDDTRNSPSVSLVERLEERHIQAIIHDPYLPQFNGDLYQLANGCDAVILMVKHQAYLDLDLARLCAALRTPLFMDGRGAYTAGQALAAGFSYWGIGRGFIPPVESPQA